MCGLSRQVSLRDVSVAVVGAGFSGIAAGVYLREAGCRDFVIYESSAGPGGTWWHTRYPGGEVDTPSHLYSYSFKTYDWSRPYAGHAELRSYLHETIADHGLGRHLRLGTEVDRATWDEDRQQYQVSTSDGEVRHFNAVISCVGMLNEPRIPQLTGMDSFTGKIFHSSQWDPAVDLTGKNVAIIGTGSTAAQLVPAVAGAAKSLTVFQRQPSWVDPKANEPYSRKRRAALAVRPVHLLERLRTFYQGEKLWFGGRLIRPGTKADERSLQISRDYIHATLKDRPDLIAAMTPDIPYQGRRPVHASGFLEALVRDNVTLIPRAAQAMTHTAVVDDAHEPHEADIVIMATGFQPSNYLARLDVIGRNRLALRDYWDGEPRAFLGVTVPNFPNFFMLYGPNTNFYALVHGFESQAKFAVRTLRKMVKERGTAIECRESFFIAFNEWLQNRLAKSSWAAGDNYFKSAKTGRIVTQWPDGAAVYGLLTRFLAAPSARVHRR
ncbi:NAD(P)/FAD-dependent oxidoreductase [Amycolatopsis sp. QT-25]|uniref:flavin-containing monooxygenase n=1 Tax=Amycolatopsis sp. QT-25 TaxID=3034022 RepID=UPI0023EAA0B9|nr:NAD(P)/FAD-dependent oxidoreductase [Amycolatopsis sp. QT-25]WET76548.1 NAD(P)/FAD-dependent oxidoreductase [Amycolatopsis sp. QT-25]